MTDSFRFEVKKGAGIASVFEELAQLRIEVFRDYPYLYAGTPEYEKEYLNIYTRSERSFLFTVYQGDTLVGATTCVPLMDETEEVRNAFKMSSFDPASVFYFGESILLKQFRGLGLGHRFFDEREAHARSFGDIRMACFCSVERGETHPLRPEGYRSNEKFWLKRGYARIPGLKTLMSWPDIGETSPSVKEMSFWIKKI